MFEPLFVRKPLCVRRAQKHSGAFGRIEESKTLKWHLSFSALWDHAFHPGSVSGGACTAPKSHSPKTIWKTFTQPSLSSESNNLASPPCPKRLVANRSMVFDFLLKVSWDRLRFPTTHRQLHPNLEKQYRDRMGRGQRFN